MLKLQKLYRIYEYFSVKCNNIHMCSNHTLLWYALKKEVDKFFCFSLLLYFF